MSSLTRFWFEFERTSKLSILNIGCGVTARNYEDALSLLQERLFSGRQIPTIISFVEGIDVSTLDARHVLPNLGVTVDRGIWFPQL